MPRKDSTIQHWRRSCKKNKTCILINTHHMGLNGMAIFEVIHSLSYIWIFFLFSTFLHLLRLLRILRLLRLLRKYELKIWRDLFFFHVHLAKACKSFFFPPHSWPILNNYWSQIEQTCVNSNAGTFDVAKITNKKKTQKNHEFHQDTADIASLKAHNILCCKNWLISTFLNIH